MFASTYAEDSVLILICFSIWFRILEEFLLTAVMFVQTVSWIQKLDISWKAMILIDFKPQILYILKIKHIL